MPNISVKHETWVELNSLKEPGESFDEVVNRLLAFYQYGRSSKEVKKA